MAETPLADRVTILETKMEKVDSFIADFDRVLQVRFREQAEMIDERFVQVFAEMDRRFTPIEKNLTSIQKDITILREGMKILLERVR